MPNDKQSKFTLINSAETTKQTNRIMERIIGVNTKTTAVYHAVNHYMDLLEAHEKLKEDYDKLQYEKNVIVNRVSNHFEAVKNLKKVIANN